MRNGQPGKRLFIPRLYFVPSQWPSAHAEWATRETTVHSPALISKLPIPPTELQFSTGGTCTTVAPSSSTWLADLNTSSSLWRQASAVNLAARSLVLRVACRCCFSSWRSQLATPMLLQLLAFATGSTVLCLVYWVAGSPIHWPAY